MKRIISIFLILCFSCFINCFDDKEKDPNEDPLEMNKIIPPDSTIAINLGSEFNEGTKSGTRSMDSEETSCKNKAGLLVVWGALVCYGPFIVPIAFFKALRTQIPTSISSTEVIWSFTHSGNTLEITAEKKGGAFDWEWSVEYNDFAWLTGGSMEDHSRGWWQYHDSTLTAGADNLIRVDWTRTDDENFSVTFTNNSDDPNNSAKVGDYISFTKAADDVSVTFHDMHTGTNDDGDLAEVVIAWDITTKAGSIVLNEGTIPGIVTSDCAWDPND